MEQLDLILKNYLDLMSLHEAHSLLEKDPEKKAYLNGVANGVRVAMKVFTVVYDIDEQIPVPSYPLIPGNPYSED